MWSIDLVVYLLGMTGITCVLSIWVGLVLEKRKTTIEGKEAISVKKSLFLFLIVIKRTKCEHAHSQKRKMKKVLFLKRVFQNRRYIQLHHSTSNQNLIIIRGFTNAT
jgi:hypothetical protein